MPESIYTIGHSNRSITEFLEIISHYGISAVADVRSSPYSKVFPQFNRTALHEALEGRGVSYVFLGVELGGRTNDLTCYDSGKLNYVKLGNSCLFQAGLSRIRAGMAKYRIAILCSEKDPLLCHRALLIARQLEAQGTQVEHILEVNVAEEHSKSVGRLLRLLQLETTHLFKTPEDVVDMAYGLQADKIAYELEQDNSLLRALPL
jgi:uncharacterized protein (DUF488 family)